MKIILHKSDLPENSKLKTSDSVAIDAESLGLNYLNRDKLCLAQLCNGDNEVHIIQFDRNKYHCPIMINPNSLTIHAITRFHLIQIVEA